MADYTLDNYDSNVAVGMFEIANISEDICVCCVHIFVLYIPNEYTRQFTHSMAHIILCVICDRGYCLFFLEIIIRWTHFNQQLFVMTKGKPTDSNFNSIPSTSNRLAHIGCTKKHTSNAPDGLRATMLMLRPAVR